MATNNSSHPLEDRQRIIELVARLTDVPLDEVRRRFELEEREMGVNVRQGLEQRGIAPYVWSEKLVEFYEQTDAFLYETLLWNRSPTKKVMQRWVVEFLERVGGTSQRVLLYGDGLGCDSYELARAGHDVTYFEVSKRCRDFASELFLGKGGDFTIVDRSEELPRAGFDAVVCLDVLEHVPDPPALVSQLATWLRPGGHLLVHAPFFYVAPCVSTHLKSNQKYSGDWRRLYGASGFEPVDGEFFWNPLALRLKQPGEPSRGSRLPLAARLGGLLLRLGALWSAPHIWVAKWLANKKA